MLRTLRLRDLIATLGVAAAYLAGGKLGLALAVLHPSASAVWPPTGIALAAFLLFGRRVWPGVLTGAFVVNATTAGSLATSFGIATGNLLEGLAGAELVRRFARGRDAFDRPGDVIRFAVLAGLVATTVSPSFGVTSLGLGGFLTWAQAPAVWFTWWLGDAAGALVFAPFLIVWGRTPRFGVRRRRLPEGVALLLVTLAVSSLVFGLPLPGNTHQYPIASLCVPLVIWSAFRMGSRVTTTLVVALSALAVTATMRGLGPFARESPNVSLVVLELFLAILSVTGLMVSATARERRRIYEELRDANRLKDVFLAMLSHELRTPLTAILGWTHLLKQQAHQHPHVLRGVEVIERNARAQSRLIGDILDISRIRAGKLEIRRAPVDLDVVLRSAIETVSAVADARGVRVERSGDPETGFVSGDQDRLQQIVWNVLSNAVKFARDNGTVRVRTGRSRGAVEIEIEDDGPGIDPAFLPHVFDQFRQRDSSSTRRHGGLGLGLTIARHLAGAHGGTIEARNGTPGGAVFTIRLPSLDAAETGGARAAEPGPEAHDTPLRGVRLLLVEDQDDTRDFLCTLLKGWGATVTDCDSAAEALRAFEHERFDLIVSDIGMPEQDGYALMETIRRRPVVRGGTIPAIALTAYVSAGDIARARAAGFQAHVGKPVRPEDMLATLGSVLGRAVGA